MQKHQLVEDAPLFPTIVEGLSPISNICVKNQYYFGFSEGSLADLPAILPFS